MLQSSFQSGKMCAYRSFVNRPGATKIRSRPMTTGIYGFVIGLLLIFVAPGLFTKLL